MNAHRQPAAIAQIGFDFGSQRVGVERVAQGKEECSEKQAEQDKKCNKPAHDVRVLSWCQLVTLVSWAERRAKRLRFQLRGQPME